MWSGNEPLRFHGQSYCHTGHEIRDPDGTIIAWAATEPWARRIASLLNRLEAGGFGCLARSTDEARRATSIESMNTP